MITRERQTRRQRGTTRGRETPADTTPPQTYEVSMAITTEDGTAVGEPILLVLQKTATMNVSRLADQIFDTLKRNLDVWKCANCDALVSKQLRAVRRRIGSETPVISLCPLCVSAGKDPTR